MKYESDKLLGSKKRVWEIDFLRGVAIVMMVLDHLVYDLSIMDSFIAQFNYSNAFLENLRIFGIAVHKSAIRQALHYFFLPLFLILTGISDSFTSNRYRRVITTALLALFMTTATTLFSRISGMNLLILFGVLHCIALGQLLTALIDLIPYKIVAKYAQLFLGVTIVVVGILMPWYDMPWITLNPNLNYLFGENFSTLMSITFGFLRGGADCLGVFPCAGFVLIGNYLGKSFYQEKKSLLPVLDKPFNRYYCAIGRYTIWIYLTHQIVIAIVIYALGIFN